MKNAPIFSSVSDAKLIRLLQDGAVGVLPTDTQYGLVASVAFPDSISRIYHLKQRANEPGTLLAGSMEQLQAMGLDTDTLRHASRYWPGPVSVVIPCGDNLDYLHLGRSSLAVRIPASVELRTLLQATGVLQTSSANLTGQLPAELLSDAQTYFGSSVDFYVDGGNYTGRQPSTVIKIDDGSVQVLRAGAQPIDQSG